MTFRKPSSPLGLQSAAPDGRLAAGPLFDADPDTGRRDWRAAARSVGRRLMPVLVLVLAAALGLAAVAMA